MKGDPPSGGVRGWKLRQSIQAGYTGRYFAPWYFASKVCLAKFMVEGKPKQKLDTRSLCPVAHGATIVRSNQMQTYRAFQMAKRNWRLGMGTPLGNGRLVTERSIQKQRLEMGMAILRLKEVSDANAMGDGSVQGSDVSRVPPQKRNEIFSRKTSCTCQAVARFQQ